MPTRGNPVLVARAIRGFQLQIWPERELVIVTSQPSAARSFEVGAFYWADLTPDIVTSRREEQGSISV